MGGTMNVASNRLFIAAALVCALAATDTHARTVRGVDFPETVSVAGKTLKLNGVGTRKKLVINVYLGALYCETPSKNAAALIEAEETKRIVMHFLYSEVGAEQLVEAWNEGFTNNSAGAVPALKDKIDRFNGFFTSPMKKGERMTITYYPGKGSEVDINGRIAGVIEGSDFMKALFSIWLGPKPPSGGLKEGMLGE